MRLRLKMLAPMLLIGLAFAQANDPATSQAPAPQANPAPGQSVAGAAATAKQLKETTPPPKVYRNKDMKAEGDGIPADVPANAAGTAAAPASPPAANSEDALAQKTKSFEAQGNIFRSQVLAEKSKILGIQSHIADVKNQFTLWGGSFTQDYGGATCWSDQYYVNKDWCDRGRNLQAEYQAAQRQLEQEKAKLGHLQESIRRKGYGNAVYDPD
jgi:hypothetical protein